MTENLHILHNTEDGLECFILEREKFIEWLMKEKDGTDPKQYPVFIKEIPTMDNTYNEYYIIDGENIVPLLVLPVRY